MNIPILLNYVSIQSVLHTPSAIAATPLVRGDLGNVIELRKALVNIE
ncbi:MAG: hypothetical protein ACUZ8H_08545 [Candidatus Anammoxibacter sp.]